MDALTRENILRILGSERPSPFIFVWKPPSFRALMANPGELLSPDYDTLPVKVLNCGVFVGWCYAVEYEGEVLYGPMRQHTREMVQMAIDQRAEAVTRELFGLGHAPKGDELRVWAENSLRSGESVSEAARLMILYGGAVKVPVKECA